MSSELQLVFWVTFIKDTSVLPHCSIVKRGICLNYILTNHIAAVYLSSHRALAHSWQRWVSECFHELPVKGGIKSLNSEDSCSTFMKTWTEVSAANSLLFPFTAYATKSISAAALSDCCSDTSSFPLISFKYSVMYCIHSIQSILGFNKCVMGERLESDLLTHVVSPPMCCSGTCNSLK